MQATSDTDIRKQLTALRSRREHLQAQQREITRQIERTVQQAHAEGMSELELGRVMGVARMTMRKWLGK